MYLPMTLSPLLSQPIRYDEIDYDRNYDGEAVIYQGLFLPSLVSPIPTRRKSSYKVTGQLR